MEMDGIKGLGRDYWLFWLASSLGMGASNILQYVLSLYVLDMTGSATLFASLLSVIIFPRILLTPVAGVMADRMRKSRTMALILLGEAVVLGIYFLVGQLATVGIALVYVLVVVLEAGEIFYGGCEAAILPELVEQGRLEDAISVSKVDDGVVQVAAPLAAALVYDNLSIGVAFGVIALLNLVSFALQVAIRPRFEAARDHADEVHPSIWREFMDGVRCIKDDAFLSGFIKVMPLANAFVDATFAVSIAFLLRQTFAVGAWTYSLYCSISAAVSMVVPLLAVPLVKRSQPRELFFRATLVIAAGILCIGICAVLGMGGFVPTATAVVAVIALDCVCVAASVPMQMTASIMLQTGVDKAALGRVSATLRMVSIASMALGDMAFGLLNDAMAVWVPIFVGAAGMAASALLFRKAMRA